MKGSCNWLPICVCPHLTPYIHVKVRDNLESVPEILDGGNLAFQTIWDPEMRSGNSFLTPGNPKFENKPVAASDLYPLHDPAQCQ